MFSLTVSWQRILTQELHQSHSRYHCTTAHTKSLNHTFSLHRPTSNSSSTILLKFLNSQFQFSDPLSQSYVTTDGQSASLSWNKAPIWGLRPDLYYCQTVAGLLCGALSLTRGRVCRLSESQSAVISLLSVCTIYILCVIKCMYLQHIQGLCQS
jgi:hypothetical protein